MDANISVPERKPRQPRPRMQPNKLRDWLERRPRPMTKIDFAHEVGCSPAYLSQLLADNPCWPNREFARRIGEVTKGAVTPNDLAGYY
jgi:hypothetical protein